MRELLFKNLISDDRKKRVIASSEIMDKQGVHSIIRRHFVYIVKEVARESKEKPLPPPYLYILKEHNNKEGKEKFFYRMKGSTYITTKENLFLVRFTHSLKIGLTSIPANSI